MSHSSSSSSSSMPNHHHHHTKILLSLLKRFQLLVVDANGDDSSSSSSSSSSSDDSKCREKKEEEEDDHSDYYYYDRLELDHNHDDDGEEMEFTFSDLIRSLLLWSSSSSCCCCCCCCCNTIVPNIQEVYISSRFLERLTLEQVRVLFDAIGKFPRLRSFELHLHHLHPMVDDTIAFSIPQIVCDEIILTNYVSRHNNNNDGSSNDYHAARTSTTKNMTTTTTTMTTMTTTTTTLTELTLWNIPMENNDQVLRLANALQCLVSLSDLCMNMQQGEDVDNIDPIFQALSILPTMKKIFMGMAYRHRRQRQQQSQSWRTENENNTIPLSSMITSSLSSSPLAALCRSPSLRALGLDQITLHVSHIIACVSPALQPTNILSTTTTTTKPNDNHNRGGGDDDADDDCNATGGGSGGGGGGGGDNDDDNNNHNYTNHTNVVDTDVLLENSIVSRMRVLSLWNTGDRFPHKCAIQLGQMLRVNQSLHWLTLQNVGLDDTCCIAIANALKDNATLEELVLSQNVRIGRTGYQALIQMLQIKNNSLRSILVNDNPIDDDLKLEMDLFLNLDRTILRNVHTIDNETWVNNVLISQRNNTNVLLYLLHMNPSICCCSSSSSS